MAKVDEYRGWFVTGSLILILVAAVPALGLFIRLPEGPERFSELWLLGPTRRAEGYPFNVSVGEPYLVYMGVANRLGSPAYYRVYVKLRNQTQPLPTASNSSPSELPSLYEFDFFVRDDEVWEKPLNFVVLEVSAQNDSLLLRRLELGDIVFQVDTLAGWDDERRGFYFQLFFELWLYNATLGSARYHNRFVSLWLNVTNS